MFETRLSGLQRDRILEFSSFGKKGVAVKTCWLNTIDPSSFTLTNTIV
jgi:hypothetical protein